ncbi:MAG UNVERIFIED_CONTAM: hypothetical protein LVR18_15825 [Planctomycetaceae bacterium]
MTTQNSGGVAINHTGTVTILGDGDIQADGTVSISAAAISTAGDIQTTDDEITLTGVTTLTGSITLATGAGAGDITLNGTIDATTAGAQDLTLSAGTGNITLGAAAGQNVALGQITIQSATDVSLQNVRSSGLKQEAGTGMTALAGSVTTTGAAGVDLKGKDLRIEKLVTTPKQRRCRRRSRRNRHNTCRRRHSVRWCCINLCSKHHDGWRYQNDWGQRYAGRQCRSHWHDSH